MNFQTIYDLRKYLYTEYSRLKKDYSNDDAIIEEIINGINNITSDSGLIVFQNFVGLVMVYYYGIMSGKSLGLTQEVLFKNIEKKDLVECVRAAFADISFVKECIKTILQNDIILDYRAKRELDKFRHYMILQKANSSSTYSRIHPNIDEEIAFAEANLEDYNRYIKREKIKRLKLFSINEFISYYIAFYDDFDDKEEFIHLLINCAKSDELKRKIKAFFLINYYRMEFFVSEKNKMSQKVTNKVLAAIDDDDAYHEILKRLSNCSFGDMIIDRNTVVDFDNMGDRDIRFPRSAKRDCRYINSLVVKARNR